jgi:hypothetical protein
MYFGTRPRIPSYFALEAQTGDHSVGRVLRFDSFSKIISAGIRIGFVTGPTTLVDAIDKHVSTQLWFPTFPLLKALADGDCEPPVVVLRPSGRLHPPALVGARRLPRAHAQSGGFLSRKARRVRGGHAAAPSRPRGVEHPRGWDVLLVPLKLIIRSAAADGKRPSGSSSCLARTVTRRAS